MNQKFDAQGLSYVHISPDFQTEPTNNLLVDNRKGCPKNGTPISRFKGSSSIEYAKGGRLLTLKSKEFDRGYRTDVDTKRGQIKGFSRKSRQRLMRKIHSINADEVGKPVFLTLTYPKDYPTDTKTFKRHLDVFNKSLVRAYPDIWGLWRMEFQERGAVHFHYLLWDGIHVNTVKGYSKKRKKITMVNDRHDKHNQDVFSWISQTWYDIVDSGDINHLAAGTSIEMVDSWNGVVHYTSKYITKADSENHNCGRYWGEIQRRKWKIQLQGETLTEDQFIRIRRVIRKKMQKDRNDKLAEFMATKKSMPDNIFINIKRKMSRPVTISEGVTYYLREETTKKLINLYKE